MQLPNEKWYPSLNGTRTPDNEPVAYSEASIELLKCRIGGTQEHTHTPLDLFDYREQGVIVFLGKQLRLVRY